jgi:hypothetical protein
MNKTNVLKPGYFLGYQAATLCLIHCLIVPEPILTH